MAVTANDGYQFEVDLGVDWRAHEPVHLQVGPVLALPDAVANKVGALYSRAAARDFLDVDTIRQSGRFTDKELLRLAVEHDPGSTRHSSPNNSAKSPRCEPPRSPSTA